MEKKKTTPVMFRRITKELSLEDGPLAYTAKPGDVVAAVLARAGSYDHELAEYRPLVYTVKGSVGPSTSGYNYYALLKASEEADAPLPLGRRMLRDGIEWRVVKWSGSASGWHAQLRREDAERMSARAERIREGHERAVEDWARKEGAE